MARWQRSGRFVIVNITIILALIAANGGLALAEIALVSSKQARLQKLVNQGNLRAKAAMALTEHPSRVLSAIQVGMTLIMLVNGVFSGATIAEPIELQMRKLPGIGDYAHGFSISVVAIMVTFLTVVFGELVPKRLALAHPERFSLVVARPMKAFVAFCSPIIYVLAAITDGILKVLGFHGDRSAKVSDEEVSLLIDQGLTEGVFQEAEKRMVEGVLALDRVTVPAIMTPRPRMVWIDIDDPDEANWRKIVTSGHSHFPVYRGNSDNVVGMLSVKALWANSAAGFATPMRDLLTRPLYVAESVNGIQLLETFKHSRKHIALVTDEFGTVSGIVTLIDMLEAIVGDLPSRGQKPDAEARQRSDGSWLIDATMALGDLKELLRVPALAGEGRADFQTLGGFVMTGFGRIPTAGDVFESNGFRWEVVDMDRFRVDKVLVTRLPTPANLPDEGEVIG